MAAVAEPQHTLSSLLVPSEPSSSHSTSPSSPSLPSPSNRPPTSPTLIQGSPTSPYDLPCPAAVLHSSPSSPIVPTSETGHFFSESQSHQISNSAEQFRTRCHFRSQEMLEAAHLKPGEARWSCREEEGGGLELISKILATDGKKEGSTGFEGSMRDYTDETPRAKSPQISLGSLQSETGS
ncbi:hypothetical protein JCM3765_003131 [Sporobolomyces pararoseus]